MWAFCSGLWLPLLAVLWQVTWPAIWLYGWASAFPGSKASKLGTLTADEPLSQAQAQAVAAAVAKCEELAAVADGVRRALSDLVAAVGCQSAAARIGLSIGTYQRWVVGVPVGVKLERCPVAQRTPSPA